MNRGPQDGKTVCPGSQLIASTETLDGKRGTCSWCGLDYAINADGVIRHHRTIAALVR